MRNFAANAARGSTPAERSRTPLRTTVVSPRCCRRATTRRAPSSAAVSELAARSRACSRTGRPSRRTRCSNAGAPASRSSRPGASATSSRSRRQVRPSLYDPFADRPAPLVPREWRFEVGGRLDADGTELEAWDGVVPGNPRCRRSRRRGAAPLRSQLRPRTGRRGGTASHRSRCHDVERGVTRVPRVRTHGHHRCQRVLAARMRSVSRTHRGRGRKGARDDVGRRARRRW